MGKKEKFIDKANSQKFHLLHRSQRDEAHANYEVPSNFVLVPAVDNGNNNSNNNGGGGRFEPSKHTISAHSDHINELGFANDGYDYSQHLREIGGGHFISKSGQSGAVLDLNVLSRSHGTAAELPEDCMPSAKNLDRHYEAITINHKLMDKDIRAALFDGFDEDGEFEELQDDFISQVMTEPEELDFDFDAHIAMLIARSEQTLGINDKKHNKRGVRFDQEDSDEEFPDYLVDENDFDAMHEEGFDDREESYRAGGAKDKDAAVGPLSAEAREALELQFERTMQEYEDGEIGYLSDLEEEDIGGTIDLAEDENALNEVLDEFLLAQKDNLFMEGTNIRKGVRSSVKVKAAGGADDEEEEEGAPADVEKEFREQEELQQEKETVLLNMKLAPKDTSIETCQEYLKEVRIEEEWDCESILSTYSTLDNHPTVIKDPNSKFRKYKSRHERSLDAAAAASERMSSSGSVASQSVASRSLAASRSVALAGLAAASSSGGGSLIYGTSAATGPNTLPTRGQGNVPGRIVLSGRLNLPEGFGPTQYEKRKELPQRSLDSSSAQALIESNSRSKNNSNNSNNNKELNDIAEEGSEDEESSGEEEEEEEEGEGGEVGEEEWKSRGTARKRRQETPEEKKARKEAVKEERKVKRSGKKELKTAFKAEGSKIIRSLGTEQSIDHVSVFRY